MLLSVFALLTLVSGYQGIRVSLSCWYYAVLLLLVDRNRDAFFFFFFSTCLLSYSRPNGKERIGIKIPFIYGNTLFNGLVIFSSSASTSTITVISHLDMLCSRHGIPDVVKTENVPPFNGNEFQTFSKNFGFHHRKITPLWPEANAKSERFMATLNKHVRAATGENSNWKNQIPQFLRH